MKTQQILQFKKIMNVRTDYFLDNIQIEIFQIIKGKGIKILCRHFFLINKGFISTTIYNHNGKYTCIDANYIWEHWCANCHFRIS